MRPMSSSESTTKLVTKSVRTHRLPTRLRPKIYFIFCEKMARVKCGLAMNPHHRLGNLQVGSPTVLRLIAVTEGDRLRERAIHRRLADHRSHGEWFEYTVRVRDVIILEMTSHLERDPYNQQQARIKLDKILPPAQYDPPNPPIIGRIGKI